MISSAVPRRIAGLAALGFGAGSATTVLVLDRRAESMDVRPAGIGAAVGVTSLGAGVVAARRAEQELRPTLALAGRSTAAIGAALVTGSALGLLGAAMLRGIAGRSAAARADQRVAAEQERTNVVPNDDKARLDAEATKQLAAELQQAPSPTDAARLPHGDPRVDVAGATVAAAAGAVFRQYDLNDTGYVYRGEQQRIVDGHTLSIATLMAKSPTHDDGAIGFRNAAELERVVLSGIDRAGAGVAGTIDAAEASDWLGKGALGEKDITWAGEADAFTQLTSAPAIRVEDAGWTLGAFSGATGPILYLPGIETESAAREFTRTLVYDDRPSPVLVRLPEGAPSTFGIVTLLRDGARSADRPEQASMPALLANRNIVAIANKQGVFGRD